MTAGGELLRLVPGRTWGRIYYITGLSVSELGKQQYGLPIRPVLECFNRVALGHAKQVWLILRLLVPFDP
jgi:hypothetical protein